MYETWILGKSGIAKKARRAKEFLILLVFSPERNLSYGTTYSHPTRYHHHGDDLAASAIFEASAMQGRLKFTGYTASRRLGFALLEPRYHPGSGSTLPPIPAQTGPVEPLAPCLMVSAAQFIISSTLRSSYLILSGATL
jgi:hypothetical protein